MPPEVTTSRLANATARAMVRAFDKFQDEFREITRRAKQRFAQRDWHGLHADSAERMDVYEGIVDTVVAEVRERLGDRVRSRLVWISIKAVFSGRIDERDDWEVAETFFNSVTRRIFTTVGVDKEIEFVHTDYESPPTRAKHPVHRVYEAARPMENVIREVLAAYDLPLDAKGLEREVSLASAEIRRRLQALGQEDVEQIEMAKPAFYRGEYAYLIGRLRTASGPVPLVFCFHHTDDGAFIDAVLTEASDVSLLFSFARTYFHVEVKRPYELVRFIKSIIPRKPTAEIYISIGYNKHGKTALYRHSLRHLATSTDKYQLAPGQRGMVMAVFTMPSYPVVFKVIKDHFDYPKQTTRQEVIDCYRFVFKHDRVGRLVDAQCFQYLELDRHRFDSDLLDELLEIASETVSIVDERVVIKHCYAERRVTPLNIYLQEVEEQEAAAAVIDYGQAIKDLAITNIFPGDLMLKNFGLTRQRRVVFYDYDEICLLSDCKIRELPDSDDYDEQMAAEPWYSVGKHDLFPEEFRYFLGLASPLREVFLEHHADLLTVDYWRDVQRPLLAGELRHVTPYLREKRLCRREVQPSLDVSPVSVTVDEPAR